MAIAARSGPSPVRPSVPGIDKLSNANGISRPWQLPTIPSSTGVGHVNQYIQVLLLAATRCSAILCARWRNAVSVRTEEMSCHGSSFGRFCSYVLLARAACSPKVCVHSSSQCSSLCWFCAGSKAAHSRFSSRFVPTTNGRGDAAAVAKMSCGNAPPPAAGVKWSKFSVGIASSFACTPNISSIVKLCKSCREETSACSKNVCSACMARSLVRSCPMLGLMAHAL